MNFEDNTFGLSLRGEETTASQSVADSYLRLTEQLSDGAALSKLIAELRRLGLQEVALARPTVS